MNDKLFVVRVVNWSPVGVPNITCSPGEKFYTLEDAKNYIKKNINNNPMLGQFVIVEHGNGAPKLVHFNP